MVLSQVARVVIGIAFALLAWWLDGGASGGLIFLAKAKAPSVPKPVTPPTPTDAQAQAAAAETSRTQAVKAGAFGDATIATSPLGDKMPGSQNLNSPQLRARLG